MSKDNYVSTDEESLMNNAVKYFKKVIYSQYILFDNIFMKIYILIENYEDVSTIERKIQKRKFEENYFIEEEKIIRRIRVTRRKYNVIEESQKRLRRLM